MLKGEGGPREKRMGEVGEVASVSSVDDFGSMESNKMANSTERPDQQHVTGVEIGDKQVSEAETTSSESFAVEAAFADEADAAVGLGEEVVLGVEEGAMKGIYSLSNIVTYTPLTAPQLDSASEPFESVVAAAAPENAWRTCIEDPFEDYDLGRVVHNQDGQVFILNELRRSVESIYIVLTADSLLTHC